MHLRELTATPSPEQVLAAARDLPGLCWLDGGPDARSIFCWAPSATIEPGPGWLERARAALRDAPPPDGAPFAGGLVGCIGYEAGRHVERMPSPKSPPPLPELLLRRYEGGLCLTPDGWVAAGEAGFVAAAAEVVAQAASLTPADPGPPTGRLTDGGDPAGFRAGVAQVLRHIRAGDCYQVNLARRLVFDRAGDPGDAYLRLRRGAPAGFGALLYTPGGAVLSNSPERFLQIDGRRVISTPIKGTAPLGRDPAEDARLRQALLESEKERAELTMIVDLVRNDLGRVCRPGSVTAGPRVLQGLPTLTHAVQTVRGELVAGRDALDAIAAAFPPGSVTGAPKVAAMQILRDLEPWPRGVYTGAIGWIGDGPPERARAALSVAIRTATITDDRAYVHVGCGIVADSDPDRELAESELKAVALRRALQGRSGAVG